MNRMTETTTVTAETTKDGRPYWKDSDAIRAASRYADSLCYYANRAIIPVLRWCNLPITQDTVLAGLGGLEAIEEAFIDSAKEPKLSAFLVNAVEDEARRQFAEYTERVEQIKKPKQKEFYYSNGDSYIYPEDIVQFLILTGESLRPDYAAIEAQYTHYLTDEDLTCYERQKRACDAINDFFRGRADAYVFGGAFTFVGGEVFPNTKFKYNLLKTK